LHERSDKGEGGEPWLKSVEGVRPGEADELGLEADCAIGD